MYISTLVGNILHGLTYYANWLYLVLMGRMVCGGGFTFFMYTKRYCTDPRIVGIDSDGLDVAVVARGGGFRDVVRVPFSQRCVDADAVERELEQLAG